MGLSIILSSWLYIPMKYSVKFDIFMFFQVTHHFTVPWPKVCIDVVKDKFTGRDLIAQSLDGRSQTGKDNQQLC